MPTGRIRMFDAKRRFGFLVAEDGDEYYVPATASAGRSVPVTRSSSNLRRPRATDVPSPR